MGVLHTTEARFCNHSSSGKAIKITYFECVFVVLGTSMQCAFAILLLPARLYSIFQIILNRHNFRKKVIEHKICVLSFSTTYI